MFFFYQVCFNLSPLRKWIKACLSVGISKLSSFSFKMHKDKNLSFYFCKRKNTNFYLLIILWKHAKIRIFNFDFANAKIRILLIIFLWRLARQLANITCSSKALSRAAWPRFGTGTTGRQFEDAQNKNFLFCFCKRTNSNFYWINISKIVNAKNKNF